MKKQVLVIKMTPYNGLTSSNMRMLAMVKGMLELGWQVDLLTMKPGNVTQLNDMSDYPFMDQVRIITAGQNASYERLTASADKGIKRKLLPYLRKIYHRLSLYDHTAKIASGLSISLLPHQSYDCVISVSDPKTSHIALQTLRRQGLRCGRIIQYWGDPLYGDISQKALFPTFYMKMQERRLMRGADRIVYTSPFTLKTQRQVYPDFADRMTFVPTASNASKEYPDTANDLYTVGYYGAYTSAIRDLKPLYDAFADLKGEARLNLVGNSDIVFEETENVMIRQRGVVKELEEQTDLFVCVLNRLGTQIPGKLYYLAATNRPVLVVLDGDQQEEMLSYLNSFQRYITCVNTPEAICRAIREIRQNDQKWQPCPLLEPAAIVKRMLD